MLCIQNTSTSFADIPAAAIHDLCSIQYHLGSTSRTCLHFRTHCVHPKSPGIPMLRCVSFTYFELTSKRSRRLQIDWFIVFYTITLNLLRTDLFNFGWKVPPFHSNSPIEEEKYANKICLKKICYHYISVSI